jgi:hypothetical protein
MLVVCGKGRRVGEGRGLRDRSFWKKEKCRKIEERQIRRHKKDPPEVGWYCKIVALSPSLTHYERERGNSSVCTVRRAGGN